MKKLLLLWPVVLTFGCAGGYLPSYYFNQLQVVNLSGGPIQDVELRVVGSDRRVACERVARNAICNDRFGSRRYPAEGLDLNWTHADGSRKNAMLTPPVPAYFATGLTLQVYLEIQENGTVRPYYDQEDPGRGGLFTIGD